MSVSDNIQTFIDRHDCTTEQQYNCLVEEQGELAEAILREDREAIREELGDVLFVARTLCSLEGCSAEVALNSLVERQPHENIETARELIERYEDCDPSEYNCVDSLAFAVGKLGIGIHEPSSISPHLLGDVLLVAHSAAKMYDADGDELLAFTAAENNRKNTETDGQKVTKSTSN